MCAGWYVPFYCVNYDSMWNSSEHKHDCSFESWICVSFQTFYSMYLPPLQIRPSVWAVTKTQSGLQREATYVTPRSYSSSRGKIPSPLCYLHFQDSASSWLYWFQLSSCTSTTPLWSKLLEDHWARSFCCLWSSVSSVPCYLSVGQTISSVKLARYFLA